MALKCKGVFVIGAKRTPFCKHGGSLRELPASHVFAAAAKGAMHSANLDPNFIDNTVVGNVHFLSQCDGGKTARYCGLYSGVPIDKPALGINKAAGTGLQALISSAVDILTGSAQISLTGGTELMSSLPLLVRNVRFGTTLATSYQLEDYIKKENVDSYTGVTIHRIAEDLAKKYGVSREMADEYAMQSRLKWRSAQNSKKFNDEVTSITVIRGKNEIIVDKDDLQSFTAQDLKQLLPLVKDGAVLTSGNSFAPADGASALLLANEESLKLHRLQPLARVAGWASTGEDPVTGLGGEAAVRKLLENQGMGVNDVDLFEINETFASQSLITIRELNLDTNKVNVNGGTLALGDPVAATGARMVTHLVHELRRRNARRAVAASSCGVGQGVAIMLETV